MEYIKGTTMQNGAVPLHDDRKLFEFFLLDEGGGGGGWQQAGIIVGSNTIQEACVQKGL